MTCYINVNVLNFLIFVSSTIVIRWFLKFVSEWISGYIYWNKNVEDIALCFVYDCGLAAECHNVVPLGETVFCFPLFACFCMLGGYWGRCDFCECLYQGIFSYLYYMPETHFMFCNVAKDYIFNHTVLTYWYTYTHS